MNAKVESIENYLDVPVDINNGKADEVRMIGFIQDEFEPPTELKQKVPENFMSDANVPSDFLEEAKQLQNSWVGEDGNIHFSRNFQPKPFIGTDNKVYLWVGDLTMKTNSLFMQNMNEGLALVDIAKSKEDS